MIEGIHIEMPHTKLAALLNERAEFHERKAEKQRAAAVAVKDVMQDDDEAQRETGYANQTTVGAKQHMAQAAASHEKRGRYLRLLAENLIPETYRLDESDLARLELLS